MVLRAADLQGRNRLRRFEHYRAYHELFDEWTGARFSVVPRIGHQGGRMMASEPVRQVVFR